MPELPEVQTVVDGMNKKIKGKKIQLTWTDYDSKFYYGKNSIKDPKYFKNFSKNIIGAKIKKIERRAKNIKIYLDNDKIILVHLKMTGHFLFGNYKFDKQNNIFIPKGNSIERSDLKKDKTGKLKNEIEKNPLRDPFNKFIHFAIIFSDGNVLALSDMRKFASVSIINKNDILEHFSDIGPEPFDIKPTMFSKMAKEKRGRIKTVLMNPEFIAGIGNIYSDEILWKIGIHPDSEISKVPSFKLKELIKYTKKILKKSISVGGDSMSDFRNIDGRKGKFQNSHNAYRLENTDCKMINCGGIIKKKMVGGRVSRFCPKHQKLFN